MFTCIGIFVVTWCLCIWLFDLANTSKPTRTRKKDTTRDTSRDTTWVWVMIGLVIFYVLIMVCLCGWLFMTLGG